MPVSFPARTQATKPKRTRGGVVTPNKPGRIIFKIQVVATKSPILFWVQWSDNRGRQVNGKVMNATQVLRWFTTVISHLTFKSG